MSDPSVAALLPVIVTLVVALTARNVLVGLFSGVLVGVAMVADVSPLLFVPALVQDYIVPEVADTYNASVLVLLVFIGGFVKLIEYSGGGTAFARTAARWVSGKARAQLAAWSGGIMIFFSDLGTPLIVGPVFQPLMDRLRISRQKLAFILDSTSSPVAILIPFIGWGVFIMSVIADAFSANNIGMSEWDAFVAAIPFQLYAWLAITMVPALTLLRFDYGAMAIAEREAAAKQEALPLVATVTIEKDGAAKPVLVWLPLLVLGATLFGTLAHYGFPFKQVAGTDFRASLAAAYFLAAVVMVILMVRMGVKELRDTFNKYIEGMTGMMTIAATLVLAWALGSVSEALGTFATGSSWGTIIIMMPLAIPAAEATGAALPVVIGAVLSGGLFGDHSSPVSETTILSSTGAGTTPLEHFRTQLPYSLTNGVIAFCGFLIAGLTGVSWIAVLVIAAQAAVLLAIKARLSTESRATNH
jgi:Na+/H+ antiporter NhaC